MSDKVSLHVAGRRVDKFLRYRIEADLYTADDAFSLEFARAGFDIEPGQSCRLYVNDRLELTGLIDRVEDGTGKSGDTLSVSGRDLLGLLVDSCVEEFDDLEEVSILALAEKLLRTVPFINRKAIVYQAGVAGAAAQQTGGNELLGAVHRHAKIEPGQTVFEVLKAYAVARGAMFFALPDGTLVFGRPKAKGAPAFRVVMRRDGAGNNVLSGKRIRDLSRRYSKIVVLGQQQGADALGAADLNTAATLTDEQVPFYKPLVRTVNEDDKSPAQTARMLLEQQRAEGFQLIYRAARHSQAGRNWAVNELCRVADEPRKIDGSFLIYGRVFELSKEEGQTTEIRLGLPGVIR